MKRTSRHHDDAHPSVMHMDGMVPQRLPLPAPGSQAELALVALALNGSVRPADFVEARIDRGFLHAVAWLLRAGYPIVAVHACSPRWTWRGVPWPAWPGDFQCGDGWSFTLATLRGWAIARVLDA